MAASIAVEQESGTWTGCVRVHPHNGYYAGDFARAQQVSPAAWSAPVAPFDAQAR